MFATMPRTRRQQVHHGGQRPSGIKQPNTKTRPTTATAPYTRPPGTAEQRATGTSRDCHCVDSALALEAHRNLAVDGSP